jgi:hypothetical protein
VVFAVKVVDVALPFASVVSVSVAVLLPNVPLAPEDGAVNVTLAPLTGDPPFVTVATRGAAKAAPVCALCELPLVAAIVVVGGGGGFVLLLDPLLHATKAANIVRAMRVKICLAYFTGLLPLPKISELLGKGLTGLSGIVVPAL